MFDFLEDIAKPAGMLLVLAAGVALVWQRDAERWHYGDLVVLQTMVYQERATAQQVAALSMAALEAAATGPGTPLSFGQHVAQSVHVRRSWMRAGQMRDPFGGMARTDAAADAVHVVYQATTRGDCEAMLMAHPLAPVASVSLAGSPDMALPVTERTARKACTATALPSEVAWTTPRR
jgi:hypothetical protein